MLVYVITNIANGKQYVGITVGTLRKRWREHKHAARSGSDRPLYRAIRLYGVDSFIIEEVAVAETREALEILEVKYIETLGTYIRNGGYNLTLGGEGVSGIIRPCGENASVSKLSDEIVAFIRSPINNKYANKTLVMMVKDLFGVQASRDCLRDARRGDTWKHLNEKHPPCKRKQGVKSEPMSDARKAEAKITLDKYRDQAVKEAKKAQDAKYLGKRHFNSKLSEDDVRNIFFSTESLNKTANKYETSRKSVQLIKQRKTHKYITEAL